MLKSSLELVTFSMIEAHTWLTEAMVTFYYLVIGNLLVCKIGGNLLFLAQLPHQKKIIWI